MGAPPLVITGMHRSGTSATARLLQSAGLDLGRRLMVPRLDNPLGYYEDLEFYDLNVALLAAGVGDDPRYRPHWAFAEQIVPSRLAPLRPRAAELLAARSAREEAWGFKDPRAAVLLDFYDELAPEARYLFVYRPPWDVVSSLLRTQYRLLRGRADLAVRAWTYSNTRLLDFRDRHPGRTVLLHVDAVADRPDAVVGLAQAQLRALGLGTLDLEARPDAFADSLMRRSDERGPLAELLAADHPQALALYERLELAADLPSRSSGLHEGPTAVRVDDREATLPLDLVLVDGDLDGSEAVRRVARPLAAGAAARIADAGIDQMPGDLVGVVMEGPVRPEALDAAVAALAADDGMGAVLLAPGDVLSPPVAHDPWDAPEAGLAIVARRETWLTVRGFTGIDVPDGFETWGFAVGCQAHGVRVARIAGALAVTPAVRDPAEARRRVLEQHPAFAARFALETEELRDLAEAELDHTRPALAATTADLEDARAALAAKTAELDRLRATRAWRLVTSWWRLRGRLRRGRS